MVSLLNLERLKKYYSHSARWDRKAVFLVFGFVLVQSQGFTNLLLRQSLAKNQKSSLRIGYSIFLTALIPREKRDCERDSILTRLSDGEVEDLRWFSKSKAMEKNINNEDGFMSDTSQRHEILKDASFWTSLAYSACGWLREAEDASLRRFWIDDFLPESATNTKRGVDIEGTAWVGNGPRDQQPYRFIVSVPQKMLHRRRDGFSIEGFVLDEKQRTLQVEIGNENQADSFKGEAD